MNVPTPAATAAPLHLYDYTHGQRRLTLWREADIHGRVVVYASVAVPVIEQPPGEAPETIWRMVAAASSTEPGVVEHRALAFGAAGDWSLVLDGVTFPLLQMEAEAVAAYLGIALPASEGGDA